MKKRIETRPCVLCRYLGLADDSPASCHHLQTNRLRKNEETIPLCWHHHQGPEGIHGLGKKGFERRYKVSEADLLALSKDL